MATKIGTRGSKLALKQVDIVIEELGISDYEVVVIKTEGDRRSEEGKTQFDKLNFVEAIENKLIAGDIDIAFTLQKICLPKIIQNSKIPI